MFWERPNMASSVFLAWEPRATNSTAVGNSLKKKKLVEKIWASSSWVSFTDSWEPSSFSKCLRWFATKSQSWLVCVLALTYPRDARTRPDGKTTMAIWHLESESWLQVDTYSYAENFIGCEPQLMDPCEKHVNCLPVYFRVRHPLHFHTTSTLVEIFCQSLCCCRDRTTDQDGSCKCLLIMGGHSVISKEMRERKRTKKSICEARVDN